MGTLSERYGKKKGDREGRNVGVGVFPTPNFLEEK